MRLPLPLARKMAAPITHHITRPLRPVCSELWTVAYYLVVNCSQDKCSPDSWNWKADSCSPLWQFQFHFSIQHLATSLQTRCTFMSTLNMFGPYLCSMRWQLYLLSNANYLNININSIVPILCTPENYLMSNCTHFHFPGEQLSSEQQSGEPLLRHLC